MAVRDGRIALIGPADAVIAAAPDLAVTDLGGDLLLPGLVDAHCHLEWSLLDGLLGPRDFADWLGRLLPLRALMTPDDHLAAARFGALRALRAGSTTLADAGPTGAGARALAESGQGGVVHLEAFGRPEGRAATEAAAALASRLAEIDDACGPGVRAGVSPHAPYTVGPALWRALRARPDLAERPWATHLAESRHELEAIRDGGGALGDLFAGAGLAPGRWDADDPGAGPVARLDAGGALTAGLVAAHCVLLDPDDAEILAARGVAVAHCPRSNAHLRCGRAPLEALREAGVAVALGSDSPASGGDYDLRAEARACRVAHAGVHDVDDGTLLGLITRDAAAALGREGEVGSLAPGRRADLLVLAPVVHDDAPVTAALDPATTVRMVVVGGEVLVSDGHATRLDHDAIVARAREARARLC